ncbi:phosphotransferase family protein [Ramlibacter albus]|uniref:Phosphotransferase family protein n=1 Tax=Ramlibacter albus TaxID=2079448 RepID=A0A923S7F8_9BURK|nr:phosphotransferase family protein [Ramlibacter albus]MBC5767092.1 phosphotransferase family protein [Ramlibacter albus]
MIPQTVEVPPQNRLDEAALDAFLAEHLPEYAGGLRVAQFPNGYSNPTYALDAIDKDGRTRQYVLRKRPASATLPSAHRVDREFRVLSALQATDVPVPRARAFCDDPQVLGSMFFVMDRVQGRLFSDPTLPGCTPEQRKAIYASMVDVLARLHAVDYKDIGLADYGKPGDYLQRQVELWTRQFQAAQTEDLRPMQQLGDWLAANVPAEGRTSIVHGDYRPNNLLVHPTEPHVLAVLDWELSTLGDPLCDLAYTCFCYYIHEKPVGFGGADPVALGIPAEDEYIRLYCERTGTSVRDWTFYLALQLYKSSSILQGVVKRALQGAGPAAWLEKRPVVAQRAELALALIEKSKQ